MNVAFPGKARNVQNDRKLRIISNTVKASFIRTSSLASCELVKLTFATSATHKESSLLRQLTSLLDRRPRLS